MLWNVLFKTILISCSVASEMNTLHPIVKLKQGFLRGALNETFQGMPYYSFSGIPYAEPPVGKLRFKDPVPASSWEGIKDATKEKDMPAQWHIDNMKYSGVEDCLYLNVHTPVLNDMDNLLPVMVHIFGGGMVSGYSSYKTFRPDNFIDENMVFIHLNYRIGLMGFLCTDPVNARGDMGLKDQNVALRWIKDNIKMFNGDPDRVTLFGCSSGSATIDYHILSPMSKGLFQRAILQSGSAMNIWARSFDAIKYAERLAVHLGYNKITNETLFDFLNQFDAETLVVAASKIMNKNDFKKGRIFGFPPVINEFKDNHGFFNEEPHNLLEKGDYNVVDILSGVADYEGYYIAGYYQSVDAKQDLLDGNFKDYIPTYFNVEFEGFDSILDDVYKNTSESYKERKIGLPTNVVNFLSDLHINSGVFHSLQERLKRNITKEYLYYYTYNIEADNPDIRGANHASELILIGHIKERNITLDDILVEKYLAKLWSNFAKTGNPTPEPTDLINLKWLPVTKDNFQYLKINENLSMQNELFTKRRYLWSELYKHVKL